VSKVFANDLETPLEVVYSFPLDPSGSVYELEVQTKEGLVRGIVQERQEAADNYGDALASGHGAVRLEIDENRPDVRQLS
jgi:hypothetical protein